MLLADTHTHTKFSSDSKAEPKEMLATAKAAGLSALCFTDHMDLDFPGDDIDDSGNDSVSRRCRRIVLLT